MLTDEISRLLSDQFHTLQTLLQHSQTQCEMIREGRMTELLDVLSRKTPLIQSLQGTAAKLNSVASANPTLGRSSDPAAMPGNVGFAHADRIRMRIVVGGVASGHERSNRRV
jgi:hypothetical protein